MKSLWFSFDFIFEFDRYSCFVLFSFFFFFTWTVFCARVIHLARILYIIIENSSLKYTSVSARMALYVTLSHTQIEGKQFEIPFWNRQTKNNLYEYVFLNKKKCCWEFIFPLSYLFIFYFIHIITHNVCVCAVRYLFIEIKISKMIAFMVIFMIYKLQNVIFIHILCCEVFHHNFRKKRDLLHLSIALGGFGWVFFLSILNANRATTMGFRVDILYSYIHRTLIFTYIW